MKRYVRVIIIAASLVFAFLVWYGLRLAFGTYDCSPEMMKYEGTCFERIIFLLVPIMVATATFLFGVTQAFPEFLIQETDANIIPPS